MLLPAPRAGRTRFYSSLEALRFWPKRHDTQAPPPACCVTFRLGGKSFKMLTAKPVKMVGCVIRLENCKRVLPEL